LAGADEAARQREMLAVGQHGEACGEHLPLAAPVQPLQRQQGAVGADQGEQILRGGGGIASESEGADGPGAERQHGEQPRAKRRAGEACAIGQHEHRIRLRRIRPPRHEDRLGRHRRIRQLQQGERQQGASRQHDASLPAPD
jgi:hypothetical protein